MNVVKPYVEIIEQEPTVEGALVLSEMALRTCYASLSNMGKVNTKDFVLDKYKMGHGEPLECNAIYLTVRYNPEVREIYIDFLERYSHNEYSKVVTGDYELYITTNYRVILDNHYEDDLKYITAPTEFHEKRITVKFGTQIVIASEINRYRKNSKGQRSTRYCNYSKDKYGNEITISQPVNISDEKLNNVKEHGFWHYINVLYNILIGNENSDSMDSVDWWWFGNLACQETYMHLTNKYFWKAQDARKNLPLDTHTEMIHTAYLSDWKHFIAQRSIETTGPAHPDVKVLADSLKSQFIEKGYIKEDEILK